MNRTTLFSLLFFICALITLQSTAQSLPKVSLKTAEGKTVSTDTLNNAGKPMIISFFALWCKPCLRELTAINEVYADWQEETGVKLIAVAVDEGQNSLKVAPAVKSYGWEYEVLLDPNADFKRALSVNLIPATFVLDGKGKIVYTHSGYTSGSEEKLIEEVRKLIEE